MSTFFQKLTGAEEENMESHGAPEPEIVAAATALQSRKTVRQATATLQERKPARIKVAAEPPPPPAPAPAKEEAPNEEGELTVDIYDAGDAIVIQSTVAGVKPEDLDITITADTITIRGSRMRQEEINEEYYYYKELFWGTFSRSVILPEEIEEDMADATLKYGLLTIRLPKKRRNVAQKLKVKAV